MARTKGQYKFSGNFEPQASAPLDARAVLNTVSELTDSSTWLAKDGASYTYIGMTTTIAGDTDENNGIYFLKGSDATDISNWVRIGSITADDLIDYQANWDTTDINDPSYIKNKPTNLSDFSNDTEYITNETSGLANYYTKTEIDGKVDTIDDALAAAVDTLEGTIADEVEALEASINTVSGAQSATADDLSTHESDTDIHITAAERAHWNNTPQLDSDNLIPVSYLPSYVDDIIEANNFASLPSTGETGKVYVTLDDNLTYRWSGTTYVEISASLALGTTSSTAFAGDRGLALENDVAAIEDDITLVRSEFADADSIINSTISNLSGDVDLKQNITDSSLETTNNTVPGAINEIYNCGSVYTNEDTTAIVVGGIDAGTNLNGRTISSILDDLFYPELFPSFTSPSVSLSENAPTLIEIGTDQSFTLTATFKRGTISPSYGTSGYRSGLATSYTYSGGLPTDVFSVVNNEGLSTSNASSYSDSCVVSGLTSETAKTVYYKVDVAYSAGEQPISSKGNSYSSALSAGSVTSSNVSLTFVYPSFATTSDITTLTKQSLSSSKTLTFALQGETDTDKQTVEIAYGLGSTISKVEAFNTVSGKWEMIDTSLFTNTLVSKTINGLAVNYHHLVHNSNKIGAQSLRFTVA